MRVHLTLDLTDDDRRKVRGALRSALGKRATGRMSRATRTELRIWCGHVIRAELDRLPLPRVRVRAAPKPAAEEPSLRGHELCVNCRQAWSDHVGLSRACPLSRTVKPGARFTAAPPTPPEAE